MPLSGTNGVVSGSRKPLPGMGCARNSVDRITGSQEVTLLVVSTMLALRWIEENVTKYRESKTPTAESIYAIDYSRRLELFETDCKVFAIPMEFRHVWSCIRSFPWFRAKLTRSRWDGKELVGCQETILRRESRYWRKTWRRT